MATHSNVPAWRIPWTGEPGRLQPMRLHTRACARAHTHTHTPPDLQTPRKGLTCSKDCMPNLVLTGLSPKQFQLPQCMGPSEYVCCGSWRRLMFAIICGRHGIFQSNCHWMLMISAPAVFRQGWKEALQNVKISWRLTRAARVISLKCKFRSDHYLP